VFVLLFVLFVYNYIMLPQSYPLYISYAHGTIYLCAERAVKQAPTNREKTSVCIRLCLLGLWNWMSVSTCKVYLLLFFSPKTAFLRLLYGSWKLFQCMRGF